MNIAIDTTPLSSTHARRGTGVYTRHLIDALEKYESQHTYTLFTRGQKVPDSVDLVHYPYFDPFFLTLPLVKPRKTVVTVHDLIPLVFPDHFPAGLRGALKWEIQKRALMGARRIITDSDASKRDIAAITGFAPARIDPIYLAPDPKLRPVRDPKTIAKVKKTYALGSKFLLYVGDVNWNKNILGMLRAFALVKEKAQLVLVGKAFVNTGISETKEINRLIESLGLESSILRTGYIPESDLASLYTSAACLLLPSFYEGFGLPVLDAFSCGCPVVASDTSSLREIGGPAVKVQPDSTDSIASGMRHILTMSPSARKTMVEAGYTWAGKFSWQRAARQTVEAYERALT